MASVLFGRRLRTDQEMHERLTNPIALAVFASDALSSVAYATEEMLVVLLPVAGAAAFGALMPLSIGIVALLVILVFSYRQTIKAYPSAGGAYIVTRDNFGLLPAQVAGVALLTDYILTVAVSVSAGVAAMFSAIPEVYPYRVIIAVVLIWIIALMNLRGVRESGRIFAVPTYVFVVSVLVLVVVGLARALMGDLDPGADAPRDRGGRRGERPGHLRAAARVRERVDRHDGCGGDLERRARVQAGRVEERPQGDGVARRAPRRHVPRASRSSPRRSSRYRARRKRSSAR